MTTPYTNLGYANFIQTTTSGSILSTDTTVPLSSVTGLPSQGILVLDPYNAATREIIFYTTTSTSGGNPRVVTPTDGRGWDGTTAITHGAGTVVIMAPTAAMFQALEDGSASTDRVRKLPLYGYTDNASTQIAIASGGTVSAGAGLNINVGACEYYYGGKKYISTGQVLVATASTTQLVCLAPQTDGTTVVSFQSSASTTPAGNITIAVVVSGAASNTSITQSGRTPAAIASIATYDPVYPKLYNFPYQASAWVPYQITSGNITGITLGNGTLLAKYYRTGNQITAHIQLTLGSTSAITGNPTILLPVKALAESYLVPEVVVGNVTMYDVSATTFYYGLATIATAAPDKVVARAINAATAIAQNTAISSTVPMTWATGDQIAWTVTYEAENGFITNYSGL